MPQPDPAHRDTREPVVFVIDDDAAMRDSLTWLIESVDIKVECFATADAFLAARDPDRPGCLVLDIRMPGMSGLELQEQLNEAECCLPVIFITGHGDVPQATRAIKNGALDFLEKPFSHHDLLERIREALAENNRCRNQRRAQQEAASALARLTGRERQVLALLVKGHANAKVAERLAISRRTVEVHRAHIMEKTSAGSVAELVRLTLLAEARDVGVRPMPAR